LVTKSQSVNVNLCTWMPPFILLIGIFKPFSFFYFGIMVFEFTLMESLPLPFPFILLPFSKDHVVLHPFPKKLFRWPPHFYSLCHLGFFYCPTFSTPSSYSLLGWFPFKCWEWNLCLFLALLLLFRLWGLIYMSQHGLLTKVLSSFSNHFFNW